ncbi:MAG: hypothetical protein KDC00_08305 [Flavobacteriales bacterium]|nr:hypothetical protein [Flavobacteriales bacterium]
MLQENRFSRYLLYAIGEIILVVIGIFLALQLNNWNAGRKETAKELGLLAEMRQNLEADLADCRYNIDMNQRLLRGNVAVLKHLDERTSFQESLRVHYGNLFGNMALVPNISAFENLKGVGFDLIRNDSLRRSITKLYSERYNYLVKLESGWDMPTQLNEVGPQIYAKVVLDTIWTSGYPIDPLALMDDHYFKGVIRMNIFTRGYMVRIYQGLEKRILGLMEQLDGELMQRIG